MQTTRARFRPSMVVGQMCMPDYPLAGAGRLDTGSYS